MKKLIIALLALFVVNTQAADVTVAWPANPPAEQATYVLEFRVNGINPWSVMADNLATNSFTTNLTSGVWREFRVAAKNITGTSAYSYGAQATAPTAPLAPTVTVVGSAVTVDWLPVTGASSYVLEYRVNGVGSWNVLVDANVLTYSQTFTPGALYSFKVSAKNITGTSPASPEASTPSVPSVPGAVTVTVN